MAESMLESKIEEGRTGIVMQAADGLAAFTTKVLVALGACREILWVQEESRSDLLMLAAVKERRRRNERTSGVRGIPMMALRLILIT